MISPTWTPSEVSTCTVAPRPKLLLLVPSARMVIQFPALCPLILQQHGRPSDARDDDIERAVVVEVGDRQPATDALGLEGRSALGRDVAERSAEVLVEQVLLRVGQLRLIQLDVVDDVSVRDVDVEVAVVVEVEQLGAEAERREPGSEAGLGRDVLEQPVAEIAGRAC